MSQLETELWAARQALAQERAYSQKLEEALMAAPLYRSANKTVAEIQYERDKAQWFHRFGDLLNHVMHHPEKQKRRIKNAMLTKLKIFQQRIGNLILRQQHGDKDVVVPSPDALMKMLYGELASV